MSRDDLAASALLQFLNAAEAGIAAAKHLTQEAEGNFSRTIMVVESYKNKT